MLYKFPIELFFYGFFLFFKRRIHNLPKFPPQVIPMFKSLCIEIPVDQLMQLKAEFDETWAKKLKEGQGHIGFDPAVADKLYGACRLLLNSYEDLPPKHRKLAIGAIRYCVATEDAYSDELFAAGQHDDIRVVNYVLEEIGLLDSFIDTDS